MKSIFLIKNTTKLNKRINLEDCVLLNLDDSSKSINLGSKEMVPVCLWQDFDKAGLEKKYLDLIASLGYRAKSIYWWASTISEKNSFISKLFSRLYKLVCLDETIKRIDNSNIAIVCADTVLMKQIVTNYRGDFAMHCLDFFFVGSYIDEFLLVLKGILKQAHKAFTEYINLLYARKVLGTKKSIISKQSDYIVLRTWADYRNYKSGSYKDPYFKSLLDFIYQSNRNVLTFAGIVSDYKGIIKRFKDTDTLIIPLNFYLKGIDLLSCLFCTYFSRPLIRKNIFLDNYNITHLIHDELLQDIATHSFFNALLQYYFCFRLTESVSIERFIYTFENSAWEKMTILGLRHKNPKIKIIGFQHAFISKNSFKYFPGKGEERISPLPDRIVTMGKRTENMMRQFGSYPQDIFATGCALRQEYLFGLPALPRRCDGDIFVPLTITIEDTVKALRFLYQAQLGTKPEKVYLRFHPATPQEIILRRIGFDLPSNFIISDGPPMETEMKRCCVVLYTWTTVCLEALKMGRPTIFLDVNYPLEVDPLFECSSLKDTCRRPSDLIGKIEKIKKLDGEIFSEELKKAKVYLDEYFIAVNDKNLSVFIDQEVRQ